MLNGTNAECSTGLAFFRTSFLTWPLLSTAALCQNSEVHTDKGWANHKEPRESHKSLSVTEWAQNQLIQLDMPSLPCRSIGHERPGKTLSSLAPKLSPAAEQCESFTAHFNPPPSATVGEQRAKELDE